MLVRFGGTRFDCLRCGVIGATHHRLANRRAYSCSQCGNHVYPTAGTILHDTRTPLVSWFYAMYLFCTTRHGVSGKELQRQIGVTYKTAYRMGQQIRDLTARADFDGLLRGHIEADEAYVGGRQRRQAGKSGRGTPGKTIIYRMKQRGGQVTAMVVPDVKKITLRDITVQHVERGSTVSTDELHSYNLLTQKGYEHGRVKRSANQWAKVEGGVVHSVNAIEGFWSLFKNSIRSTHIHVSAKHMNRYLSEFTFRQNHRERQNSMFDFLVGAL